MSAQTKEYVVLIIGDADRWWTTMTDEERAAGYAVYGRFGEELDKRGHQVTGGAELQRSSTARTIRAGGGPVTDGPFAETAEQVGGFYQVKTDDLDDLLECCRMLAELGDGIEVRPVVTDEDRESS
ncbi:MAG: YciI family protein [Knoellia sp.]